MINAARSSDTLREQCLREAKRRCVPVDLIEAAVLDPTPHRIAEVLAEAITRTVIA